MEKEEFLIKLTGSEEEEAAATSPRLQYFNKVHTLTGAVFGRTAAANKPSVDPIRCCDYWRTLVCPSL